MKKINLKDLKDSSIYITPHLPILHTKRYKFSLLSIVAYLGLFTAISWVLLIIILAVTPLKDYVFVVENEAIFEQSIKINELEQKIRFLRNEVESFASTERKLKYAIILGKDDSTKSLTKKEKTAIYDSLKKPSTSKKIKRKEGSVLSTFFMLIENVYSYFQNKDEVYFRVPVKGYVINNFDPQHGHNGIDYGVKSGSPVFAASNGLVIFADYTSDDGYTMIIQHNEKYISIYKHLSINIKKQRDIVEQGEIIALSGNSGYNTTGAHLHFEIWEDGKVVDPQTLIIN